MAEDDLDDDWEVVGSSSAPQEEQSRAGSRLRIFDGVTSLFGRALRPSPSSPHIGETEKKRRWEKNPTKFAYRARVWGLSGDSGWEENAMAHRTDPAMMLASEWSPEKLQPFTELINRGLLGLWAVYVFDDPSPAELSASTESESMAEYCQLVFDCSREGNRDGLEQLLRSYPALAHSRSNEVGLHSEDLACMSPLMCAVFHDHLGCVDALIKAGAPVDYQDSYGWTALMVAARMGRGECMERLLNEMADPDLQTTTIRGLPFGRGACDSVGVKVLKGLAVGAMFVAAAALSGDSSSSQSPVSKPEEPKGDETEAGTTALMMAVQMGRNDCTEILLRYGADHSLVDRRRKLAVDYSWNSEKADDMLYLIGNLPPRGPLLIRPGGSRKTALDTTFLLEHYTEVCSDGFHSPGPCDHWVVKGRWRAGRTDGVQDVAIKIYGTISTFQREFDYLTALQSSYVVPLLTSKHHTHLYHEHRVFSIGMPLFPMSLAEIATPVRSELACSLISQSAECLSFIHQHGLVHGNLNPYHFLLVDDAVAGRRVVVGSMCYMCKEGEMQSLPKNTSFVAPERLLCRGPYPANPASDIWSLGRIWLQLLTGSSNMESQNTDLVKPEPLRLLLLHLLKDDPQARYTAMETAGKAGALGEIGASGRMDTIVSVLESVKRNTTATRVSVAEMVARGDE